MTQDEARGIVGALVDGPAIERLTLLAALVVEENERQNLIAASTIAGIWSRHILDSVQLLLWRGPDTGLWLDIGTGGGFPGLAIAAAMPDRAFMLVEPRRRRADFLRSTAIRLGLSCVDVRQDRVENVRCRAATISARAVAPIGTLLGSSINCASPQTRWLMPRGAGYDRDLHAARGSWEGVFHVEQSLSDPSAGIVIATKVSAR